MKKQVVAASAALLLCANVASAVITNETGSTVTNSGQADASSNAASGTSSITQTFEGSDIPPYIPGTLTAPVLSPTLFNIQGRPAQVAGLQVLSQNFFATSVRKIGSGASRATRVIYNGAVLPEREASVGRKVMYDFSGRANGRIVGSLTVQSKKNSADEVDFPTVIHDATQYVGNLRELRGYDVLLLSLPELISYGIGVDSKGQGLTLAPVLSGLINGSLGALTGVATGYSSSGGVTVPTAVVGCTFLIVVQEGKSQPIDLALSYGKPAPPPSPVNANGNGNNVKKKEYEATK